MNEAVTRLAQRLKNVITVRRKRSKKGRFDIKRTLRQNLAYGVSRSSCVSRTQERESRRS